MENKTYLIKKTDNKKSYLKTNKLTLFNDKINYLELLIDSIDKLQILKDNKEDKFILSPQYIEEERVSYKDKLLKGELKTLNRVIKHLNNERNKIEVTLLK